MLRAGEFSCSIILRLPFSVHSCATKQRHEECISHQSFFIAPQNLHIDRIWLSIGKLTYFLQFVCFVCRIPQMKLKASAANLILVAPLGCRKVLITCQNLWSLTLSLTLIDSLKSWAEKMLSKIFFPLTWLLYDNLCHLYRFTDGTKTR